MIDLNKLYVIEKKTLFYTGIYPNLNKETKILTVLSAYFFMIYSYIVVFGLFIKICLEINNVEVVANVLVFLMTQLAFVLKMTNLIKNGKLILEIEEMLKKSIFQPNHRGVEIINNHMKVCKILAIIFRILCVSVVAFYMIFPFFEESTGKVYPLNMWLPFNQDNFYGFVFGFEVIGVGISALINSNQDLLCVIFISIATAQIDILKENLQSVGTNDDSCIEDNIYSNLKGCIKHYSLIHR